MIYVMSDIHGNAIRFNSIMEQIDLQPEDTLYVLGDVIDRYPDGIRILRLLMSMPNVQMLLGNHEYMMLNALDRLAKDNPEYPHALRLWYRNGGDITHEYDVFCLLHSYDWAESGDTDMDAYQKDVEIFKSRWFKKARKDRIKEMIDISTEKLKEDLYQAFGFETESSSEP